MKRKLLLFIAFQLLIWTGIYFLDKEYFTCPVEYKKDILIRSDSWGDGYFASGRSGNRLHGGIDLFAAIGTPVLASRSGLVVAATASKGMGNYVVIRHLEHFSTIYGHLKDIYVRKGQLVRQGQIIGSVGKTGNANHAGIQPHLHFEVRRNGVPRDPIEFFS